MYPRFLKTFKMDSEKLKPGPRKPFGLFPVATSIASSASSKTVQEIERLYRVLFKPRLKSIAFITFDKTIEGADVEVVLERNRQNMLSIVPLNLHRLRCQYRPLPDVVLRSTRRSKLRFLPHSSHRRRDCLYMKPVQSNCPWHMRLPEVLPIVRAAPQQVLQSRTQSIQASRYSFSKSATAYPV